MSTSLYKFGLVLAVVACSPTLYTHGVPNFVQVDSNIYRGGQITSREGWNWIASVASGRTIHVIKLNFDSEGLDTIATELGFDVLYVPVQPEGDQDIWDDVLSAFKAPDPTHVVQAEAQLAYCFAHPKTDLCYVHCTHGQDRTGFVIGKHRVLHESWTKSHAYREMIHNHFHLELYGISDAWEDWDGSVR